MQGHNLYLKSIIFECVEEFNSAIPSYAKLFSAFFLVVLLRNDNKYWSKSYA